MYERTPKESDLDTVLYEVSMLEHCYDLLMARRGDLGDPNWNLLIEGFLLHYRNLIRFYSGERHHDNDLSTQNPEVWAKRILTSDEIKALKGPGQELDKEFFNKISTYLHHCTKERAAEPMDWNVLEMHEKIKALNDVFKKSFAPQSVLTPSEKPRVEFSQSNALGTATFVKGTRIS
jgi:hypothetical protein